MLQILENITAECGGEIHAIENCSVSPRHNSADLASRGVSLRELVHSQLCPVANLFPFLDQHGLLRASGRITASTALQYDERHPIILQYNCRLSRLLVLFSHQISLHGGNQLVVRLIRSNYWIPKIKNLVKAVLNSCTV
ncbi:uncharacterized protein LOC128264161 [Drosophila gunungcola]|uniref:uncharacterized protein LOC128264161 n=1 Tax=Drosophila gunungcola TaxID=103775 RepID=UPI0022DF0869|nr:uncharacterized protein LOC128264161 [Drosophila gunungcola]